MKYLCITAASILLTFSALAQEPIETTVIADGNEITVTIKVDVLAIGEKRAETGKGVFGSIGELISQYPKTSLLTAILAYKAAEKNNLGGFFSGSGGDNSNLTGNDSDEGAIKQDNIEAPATSIIIKGNGNNIHISEQTSGSQSRFDSAN